MVQYDISIIRSKSIPKISFRTLTWWRGESSTIFDRQDSMKPKKILIIIPSDDDTHSSWTQIYNLIWHERLHYSRAAFAIYSNLHTSAANFRVFILPTKNGFMRSIFELPFKTFNWTIFGFIESYWSNCCKSRMLRANNAISRIKSNCKFAFNCYAYRQLKVGYDTLDVFFGFIKSCVCQILC